MAHRSRGAPFVLVAHRSREANSEMSARRHSAVSIRNRPRQTNSSSPPQPARARRPIGFEPGFDDRVIPDEVLLIQRSATRRRVAD